MVISGPKWVWLVSLPLFLALLGAGSYLLSDSIAQRLVGKVDPPRRKEDNPPPKLDVAQAWKDAEVTSGLERFDRQSGQGERLCGAAAPGAHR